MMQYEKGKNDKKYRRIDLRRDKLPPFEDFPDGNVQFSDGTEVIEVQDNNGIKRIIPYKPRSAIKVTINYQQNTLQFAKNFSAHLWICSKEDGGANGVRYVIPEKCTKLYVPNVNKVKLVGDDYFNAAYDIEMLPSSEE